MAEKKKLPTYTTPAFIAKWVSLGKPDTKYKPEGEYRITILVPKAGHEEFLDFLEKQRVLAVEDVKQKLMTDTKTKAKAKTIKQSNLAYKPELDAEGNETEFVQVSFKAKRKDGTEWTFRPKMFDAKGAELPVGTNVWGGTKLRVSYQCDSYYVAASQEAGLSLKLQAVKIIELKSGSGRDASAYGFGEEEDGYDSTPTEVAGAEGTPASGEDF